MIKLFKLLLKVTVIGFSLFSSLLAFGVINCPAIPNYPIVFHKCGDTYNKNWESGDFTSCDKYGLAQTEHYTIEFTPHNEIYCYTQVYLSALKNGQSNNYGDIIEFAKRNNYNVILVPLYYQFNNRPDHKMKQGFLYKLPNIANWKYGVIN